jgi:outer membrane protein assembly factor BamB
MILRRTPHAPLALVFVLLALGFAACAGDAEESEPPAPPPEATTGTHAVAPPAPPAPEVAIRVVDGDTAKPVDGARVTVSGQAAETSRRGTAQLTGSRRRAAMLRVSAPGYVPRIVRVDMRKDATHKVAVWRAAVQWPLYGANPARTQVHPAINLRPPFRRVWMRRMGGLLEFPAVVWEGVAYVNQIYGWLHAISMKNGRLLWKQRVGTRMASAPGIDPVRRLLVVTSMSPGYVSVVDMDTGRVKWRFYSGRAEPSPVIRDGVAYFGAANGNVYALDLDRRRPRWVFRGGVKITGSPSLVGNRIFVGDYAGRVVALNARTGRRVWTGSAGGRVYGTTAVAGGRVFAPSVFSGLWALSARTGRLLWRVPVGSYLYSSPAVFRGRVYFATHGGYVYSADARSGRVRWTRPAGGRVGGAVQVVAGLVYAASPGRISAWNWRTGRPVWTFPRGKYVPVSGNGARLLLHAAKQIFAVESRRQR